MAAKEYENKLLKEIKDSILQKYGRLASQLDAYVQDFHEKNIKFANQIPYFNSHFPPQLSENMPENTEITDLLETCGNTELNKVLSIFASLCEEMWKLKEVAETDFVPALALYGNGEEIENDENSGKKLSAMSRFIPLLHNLLCFMNRCFALLVNLMEQLDAIFTAGKNKKSTPQPFVEVNEGSFDIIFEYLGHLLVALINIDEVLQSHSILRNEFVNHKRIIELVNAKSSKFDVPNTDGYKLKLYLSLIVKIEKEVIDGGSIFRRIIDAVINSKRYEQIGKNSAVSERFAKFIRESMSEFDAEEMNLKNDRKWLAINALFIFYVWVFKKDDRKMMKSLLDTEKKSGLFLVHLKGNSAVSADKILFKELPKSMIDKRLFDVFNQARENIVKQSALEREVKQINIQLTNWMVQCNGILKLSQASNVNLIEILQQLKASFTEGLKLLFQASYTAKGSVILHLEYGKLMSRSDVVSLCKLINVMKAIELYLNSKKPVLLLFLSRYSQYCACVALKCLTAVKDRLTSEVKKYSEKKLDVISAVILASSCLHGPILTQKRRLLASLCCSMAAPSMTEAERSKIDVFFKKIDLCCSFFTYLKEWSNADFLYFNTPLYGVYFNHCLNHEIHNIHELGYFCYALSDAVTLMTSAYANEPGHVKERIMNFENEVWQQFKTEFLDRLCTDFETELRLHTHRDLQVGDQSPFRRKMHDFTIPASVEPIRLFNRFISISDYVQNYLNQIAYNLTTIALHDWKTYESMLNLAKFKYQMEFVTSQLPTQTLEQGLDVLEITRNIHVFVARYLYSLNNQMFVERLSENKHLNVLLIRHVSNSIQTHGFGIINTAVNFTYQFLKKKFYIFSQFLYEEHIKSRLTKDLRYFRESKAKKFPYERAEKFVKGIKSLGLTTDGLSFLDQFRILITQIGNALGFVRMLRSGAIHCGSTAVNFLPDLEELFEISFENMVSEEGFENNCVVAARNLDLVLQTLNRNFSDATDYFKLLSQVFESTFQDPKNYHLKNFYLLLPPLIINFVEYSIISKEKITRKNQNGASFIDDGFAVGVSYVLHLLDQYSDFDSLQWFSSVDDKINHDRNEALRKTSRTPLGGTEEKLSQTANLTLKRLELLQKEFELLNYSLTSCRILFKATVKHENISDNFNAN